MPDTRAAASPPSTAYVVVGPTAHGVVLHATRLADASADLAAALVRVPAAPSGHRPGGLEAALSSADRAMIHVTDRLFGGSPEEAASVIADLAARTDLVLSLHDVPQPAEGDDWYRRRRAAYRDVSRAAVQVVVASEVEADLLLRCIVDDAERRALAARTTVIPLPLERRKDPKDPMEHRLRPRGAPAHIGVLGFLYPGKGLADAIDAAAAMRAGGREVTVTNYGAAAEGHADHAEWLARYADDAGVAFRVTGYLSDADLRRAVLEADVPLAPHRHISASGSVNTWVESGRRPIVRRSPYVEELAARLPGAVTVIDDLVRALTTAVDTPETTWVASGVGVGPSWAVAAALHADLLRGSR